MDKFENFHKNILKKGSNAYWDDERTVCEYAKMSGWIDGGSESLRELFDSIRKEQVSYENLKKLVADAKNALKIKYIDNYMVAELVQESNDSNLMANLRKIREKWDKNSLIPDQDDYNDLGDLLIELIMDYSYNEMANEEIE